MGQVIIKHLSKMNDYPDEGFRLYLAYILDIN